MDKVKINSVNWNLVNATFTFDDANVPSITVNLNGMTTSDGDILAKELYAYGQKYKDDCIARVPSAAVAGSVWFEFGYENGVIVPVIPEVVPETPVEPEVPVVPETPVEPETPVDPE